MSDLAHLQAEIKRLEEKTGCYNWTVVHDTVGDRYVVVLGHDSDENVEMESAATLALEHLE